MAGHEARINDALRQLGEEFRLGMIAADEYRSRRRMLLESWGERDSTTSPGARQKVTTAPTTPRRVDPSQVKTLPPKELSKKSPVNAVVALIGAALLLGGGAYFLMKKPVRTPQGAPQAAVAPPPASAQVIAVRQAAEAFLTRNAWEAEPINAFLDDWRLLTPQDRARARDEPSVRTLRSQLQQNIEAEAQLVPADAPPEQRQRLDLLTEFARELEG